MKNLSSYVRALLVSKSGITALVGTGANARIYEQYLPRTYTLPAIMFYSDGGGDVGPAPANAQNEAALQMKTFRVLCWASTLLAAEQLSAAVHDALTASDRHTATVGADTATLSVWQEGGESPDTDPDTAERYVETTFGVAMDT